MTVSCPGFIAQTYASPGKRPGIQSSYPFRASVRFRAFGAKVLVWANSCCSFTTLSIKYGQITRWKTLVFTALQVTSESIPQRSRHPEKAKLSDTTGHGVICHWAVRRMKNSLCHIVAKCPYPAQCTALCTLPLFSSYLEMHAYKIRPWDIILKSWGNGFSNNSTQFQLLIISVSSRLSAH